MVANKLTLSQAFANFIHYKEAIGRSEHTIADYHNTRKKLIEFFDDDPPFASITRTQMIASHDNGCCSDTLSCGSQPARMSDLTDIRTSLEDKRTGVSNL